MGLRGSAKLCELERVKCGANTGKGSFFLFLDVAALDGLPKGVDNTPFDPGAVQG